MFRCFFCAPRLNRTRFLGQNPGIMGVRRGKTRVRQGVRQEREVATMVIKFLEDLLHWNEEEEVLDAEYEPFRDQLSLAGLSEEELRKMDPDDRVAVLEQANLDPYDFIYLAC